MICDFCSAPEPLNEIPVHSFSFPEHGWGSAGNFMACGICMTFIDNDDHDGLLGYALRTHAMKYPELLVNGKFHPYAESEVRRMHELFWENRIR